MANSTAKSGSFTICCISGVMGIALEVVSDMVIVLDVLSFDVLDCEREADTSYAHRHGDYAGCSGREYLPTSPSPTFPTFRRCNFLQ